MMRADFPLLANDPSLVFLDSGASSQKPACVIDAMGHVYNEGYANIHRGVYDLSVSVTDAFEAARGKAQRFLNAKSQNEIIFTRNATEGVNLVANGLIESYFKAGDEIIISEMEHHANIVPWQVACEKTGAVLRVINVLDDGTLDRVHFESLLNEKTKLLAITAVSNVLGTINPLKEMIDAAHAVGAIVFVDAAQMAPHMPIDIQALSCEFLTISGHKAYGPSGASLVYIREDWCDRLPPYQFGGAMISEVSFEKTTYAKAPLKFEAGTPAIAEIIGMGAAFDYLMTIGMGRVFEHEQALTDYAYTALSECEGVTVLGPKTNRVGVFAFTIKGVHAHDIGTILNDKNVAIRAGHHCAMPLHKRFKVAATARASLGIYNTTDDVDRLIQAIAAVNEIFAL
jgi:cysteine desulfurase / selenocysteine lyase